MPTSSNNTRFNLPSDFQVPQEIGREFTPAFITATKLLWSFAGYICIFLLKLLAMAAIIAFVALMVYLPILILIIAFEKLTDFFAQKRK